MEVILLDDFADGGIIREKTFRAHIESYDWKKFAKSFVSNLGLELSYPTTQIEHYDNLAAIFDNLKRINR